MLLSCLSHSCFSLAFSILHLCFCLVPVPTSQLTVVYGPNDIVHDGDYYEGCGDMCIRLRFDLQKPILWQGEDMVVELKTMGYAQTVSTSMLGYLVQAVKPKQVAHAHACLTSLPATCGCDAFMRLYFIHSFHAILHFGVCGFPVSTPSGWASSVPPPIHPPTTAYLARAVCCSRAAPSRL